MKHLELRVTHNQGRKSGEYTYEVIENTVVLYRTISNRIYTAMLMVGSYATGLSAANRFGRMSLVGKGDSKTLYESGKAYGLAVIDYPEVIQGDRSRILIDCTTHEPFPLSHKAYMLLISEKADYANQAMFTRDANGSPRLVWVDDLPDETTMNEVHAYLADRNCRQINWIDGNKLYPGPDKWNDQKLYFLREVRMELEYDRYMDSKVTDEPVAYPPEEVRALMATHLLETFKISDEEYERLRLEFAIGVDITEATDLEGNVWVVDLAKAKWAEESKELQAMELVDPMIAEMELNKLARMGYIAGSLAQLILEIPSTWEIMQPMFVAILERKLNELQYGQ